jgi:ubiquinone/menaquinone biosynthesis C-methylase UbiE
MMITRVPPASSDSDRVSELFRAMLPYYLHERAHDRRFLAQQRRVCAMLNGRVGRVLDIGCGPGLMTEALVERGGEVWGLDFLESALAWARAEAEKASWGDRAHYVGGDAQALPFSAATFDTVIAMGVLEYLSDAHRFVSEVRRVLRPGGLFVVAVPSRIAPYHLAQSVLDRFVGPVYRAIRRVVTGSVRRSHIPDHPRHLFIPWRLDQILARARFQKQASAFAHFYFYPLDRFFPDLTRRIDRRCTALEESTLLGWLGTQYLVAAVRRGEVGPAAG